MNIETEIEDINRLIHLSRLIEDLEGDIDNLKKVRNYSIRVISEIGELSPHSTAFSNSPVGILSEKDLASIKDTVISNFKIRIKETYDTILSELK